MTEEKESLYAYIQKNMVEGALPKEFSLPSTAPDNEIRFADGAQDGIAIYHMADADITAESLKLLEELMHDISDGNYEGAQEKLEEFIQQNTPIAAIDEFEEFIMRNTSWIDPARLHQFGMDCIMSDQVDVVKYGLEIIEVFSEPDEALKEIIRTLGLCDEFTIFSVFNMLRWSNANDEVFAIAKKVHGWGRIHAIERLEPTSDEIKKWLLEEGIINDILPEYSALEVYQKADVRTLLTSQLTQDRLCLVAKIVNTLLDEGPVYGISAIKDADAMLLDFLSQVKQFKPDLTLYETVYQIQLAERSDEVCKACQELLQTKEAKEAITDWTQKGEALDIAKNVGIDFLESLYQCIEQDFGSYWHKCEYLFQEDAYREKVVELFRQQVSQIHRTDQSEVRVGFGKEYEDDRRLMYLIQQLDEYPLCGADLVACALQSPIVGNRNMALRVLHSWCEKRACTIKELSTELFEAVETLKSKEHNESVLKNITEYAF